MYLKFASWVQSPDNTYYRLTGAALLRKNRTQSYWQVAARKSPRRQFTP
jgi:hypothetical protein